jgi:nucleoid DNA-binding protein
MTVSAGKKLVRADLVGKLREKGFSRPLATEMVNLVFAAIADALIRGEEVEFPFGYLHRVKHKHRTRRGWFLNKITTTYRNPWTVELSIDEDGRNLLDEEDRRREEASRSRSAWTRRF